MVRDPRIGYWIEEKISPSYPQAEGLQLSFEDLGGGRIRYKLGANHDPDHLLQVDAKCDGREYPMVFGSGNPIGRTYSCQIIELHTVQTFGNSTDPSIEWVTYHAVETVSEDGNTLLFTGTQMDASGRRVGEVVQRRFSRRR